MNIFHLGSKHLQIKLNLLACLNYTAVHGTICSVVIIHEMETPVDYVLTVPTVAVCTHLCVCACIYVSVYFFILSLQR